MASATELEKLKEKAESIKAGLTGENNEPVAGQSATGGTELEQLRNKAEAIRASLGLSSAGSETGGAGETALEKLRKKAETIRNDLRTSQVTGWVEQSMALMKEAESYYDSWSGKEGNRDAEFRLKASELMGSVDAMRRVYEGNEEGLASVNNISQMLEDLYNGISSAREVYSQWDTLEAYDQAVADYNMQQEALALDVDEAEAGIEALEAERKSLQKQLDAMQYIRGVIVGSEEIGKRRNELSAQIEQLSAQIQEKEKLVQTARQLREAQDNAAVQQEALALDLERAEAEIEVLEANLEHMKNVQANTFDKEKLAQLGPQITQMEQELREKKNLYQTARNLQGQQSRTEALKQLETVTANTDFQANSGYDASYGQEGIHDPHSYEAMEYDHINGEVSNVTNRYFKDKYYDQMTKDEVAVYNYYFKTQGTSAARAYLDSLQETLNYRYAENAMEGYQGKTGKELLFGVKAGWDQAMSGLKNLDRMVVDTITGKDSGYITPTGTQMLSGMVREDLGENAGWLGTTGYDIITTSANMLPSILTSTVVGLVATPGVGSTVGAAMMGGGAAGNAYQEVLNLGFGTKEAAAYGTAIGVSEAVLEKVLGGIGKLGGTSAKIAEKVAGIENGLARFCLRFGGKIGSEALEEGLQSILEPGLSNWLLDTDKDVDWSEVAYSALLGGLTGGVFGAVDLSTEAVAGKVATVKQNEAVGKWLTKEKNIGTESVQAIIESGLESPEGTESRNLAEAAQKKLEAGKALTDAELGELYLANVDQVQREEALQAAVPVSDGVDQQPGMTKNELYRQMVQQNQNGGNVNVETGIDAGAVPGNLVSDGGQGWNAGTGTGEQAGGLAEGTAIREEGFQSGAALAGDQGTGIGEAAANRSGDSRVKTLQRLASQLKLPRVSSLSLGIPEGTEKNSIRVLPKESWDAELQGIAQNVQQETGLPVTFVLGRIPVKNRQNGVRAVYTPTGIIIQADNMGATPQQLADHETYHFKADEARRAQLNQRVAERLLETYTPEELNRALDKYKENLVGIVDDEGLTEEEYLEAFTDAVLEEFLADAYAGINAFGAHAERYQGDVESAMDELMGKARNQDNGTRQTNGPNKYSYGGENSGIANIQTLANAKELFAQGVDEETIRQETGWFKSYDGRWRFEVNDSEMKVLKNLTSPMFYSHRDGEALKLAEIIKHDALFEAYPGLRDMKVKLKTTLGKGVVGTYDAKTDTLYVSGSIYMTDDMAKEMLIHEIQHKIQNIEGFARGSSPEYWRTKGIGESEYERFIAYTERERARILRGLSAEERQDYMRYVETDKQIGSLLEKVDADAILRGDDADSIKAIEATDALEAENDALYNKLYGKEWFVNLQELDDALSEGVSEKLNTVFYKNTAGEIEARDVAKRVNYTDEQRKNIRPDIDRANVVFADSGKELAYIGDTKDGRRCYQSGFDSGVSMDDRIKIFKDRIATIFNLGAVELKTDVKKIRIRGDRFTSQKNIYGDFSNDPSQQVAKINALYDLADILATATYDPKATAKEQSYANPSMKPKNKAHVGVKYWYKFRNQIVFDGVPYTVTFNIRDKGNEQYQYLIEFKENKTPGLSNTAVTNIVENNLLRTDQVSYKKTIAPIDENVKAEEWVSWENFSPAEMVQAQVEGRYDNETRMVRVPKRAETTDTKKANSQAVEKTSEGKSKFSADDLSAMEEELEMRQSQNFQDRLMEDGGSAAWVANQKRIEVLRQQMKRDPETIQKRNERDMQTEGTEPARVRVPKKKDAAKPAPVSESKPIIAKQDLRKNLLHFFSVPEGQRQELGTVIDGYADRLIKNGALTEEDRRRFFDRMYASGVMEVPADELYTAGRELLRGGRIYVNDSIRAEFGDDWQDFRRQAFAAGVYLTNDIHDGGVDHVNSYMADYLPSLFDSEETDLRMALERIVQVAEEGKSQQVSLAEYTAQLAGEQNVPESEFLDAMERHLDWALRTFAEKAELEVKLRDRTGVKIAQEREAAAQSRYKQSAREEARRLKERKERMELREQQRQQKELRELQQKTLKSLQWLSKNRQRAPEELQETWDEVLGDIDLFAVSAANEMRWSDRYGATWKDLAEMYREAKDKDPNFMPSKDLERIVSRLNDKKIGEMDIGALQDLYKAAVGLQKEFHNRNNVINDEMNRMFEEVYEDSKAEIEGAPGGFKGKYMDKLFNMQQLTPMNVLQRMGGWDPDGTFFSMAKQLERGERDIRAYTVKANRMLEEFLTEHEEWVKKCDGQGKDGIWYEMEVPEVLELHMGSKPIFGDTFKVYFTPAQKVHMYLESKNVDNLRHMIGGRTFVDKELYSEGKRQEALSQGRTVRLAPETVKAMVSELTEEERALADVLERYYNTFAKEEINRVSNALYGYDKAMGKNYAPIFSNQNYTKSELGVFDATAEGVGHMKGRVAYSKNPSYNISALDAFEKHVDQTARFTGMAIPARNWNTLLNWREKNNSTGDVITHKWGEEGKRYIEGIIENLQAGTAPEADAVSQLAEKALSNYISAVFGANPSIVLKQMGSIPMAAPYLDFKNFPTPAQIKNIDRDLIAKYTQDLAWRTMGYATPETKQLKDNPNWTQTNKPVRFLFGGGAITAMDGWAASTLWPWAENKVSRDFPELEAGTDAYYKKVAELFEYAMSRSQSVSDEIHQGTLRKSKNPLTRVFTMFRSDSAQTYNTIRQKIGEARYYKRIKADEQTQKKANKAVGTAFVASLSGLIWAEGISLLMALWKNKGKAYRDDEDELTAESILTEAGMNLVGSMAGTMVGGEELAGILGNIITGEKWYDLETPGMEQLNEIINALTDAGGGVRDSVAEMWEIAQNDGDVGKYLEEHASDIVGGVKDLAEAVAKYLAGVPVANVEAYLLGLFKWVAPELTTAYEDALATAEKAGLSGLTGGALEVRVGNIMEQRGVESQSVTEALAGLYEEGYSGVVPGSIPSKATIDGEELELNGYQQQVYGSIWGSIVAEHLETVVSSELFEDADAKMQSKLIQALYSYADAKAKEQLFDDYTLPSSIRGMEDALRSGLSMEKVLDLKVTREKEETDTGEQEYTGKLKDYMEMVANGVDPDEAHELVMHLEELEPEEGKSSVSNLQECLAIANWPWQESVKEDALKAIMSDSGYEKYMSCREAGVLTYWYFTFLNDIQDLKSDYDADGKAIKGSTRKDKVVATIDGYERLTPKQKDALFLAAGYAESGLKDCPWNR